MEYELKKRRYQGRGKRVPEGQEYRMRTLYEWEPPEMDRRFRSPDPAILDRRRWAIQGEPEDREKDRSRQTRLEKA